MFTEPRVNLIASDEGFSVEILGRTRLRYTEGSLVALIDSEALVGEPAMMIYMNRLKGWESPHGSSVVDEESKERIALNLRRAFRFRGHEVEVVT